MADIKQAAKWMMEGKRVTREVVMSQGLEQCWIDVRRAYPYADSSEPAHFIAWKDSFGRMDDVMTAEDLLADDWEIVE